MPLKFLDVGQCNFDHSRIHSVLTGQFDAHVDRAHTADQALEMIRKNEYHLVLVNRLFDSDGDSGLEFIREVKQNEATQSTPLMLVSNFEESQQQAVSLGALKGFGKAALDTNQTIRLIAAATDQSST